jgi:dihydrofolate reductase
MRAGLLDEIQIGVMPVLLGEGLRLFGLIGTDLIELERMRVVASPMRTDISSALSGKV